MPDVATQTAFAAVDAYPILGCRLSHIEPVYRSIYRLAAARCKRLLSDPTEMVVINDDGSPKFRHDISLVNTPIMTPVCTEQVVI